MMRRANSTLLMVFLAAALSPFLAAQQGQSPDKSQKQPPLREGLPQRELSEKERKKREEAMRKELESRYRQWLEEDVVYIISPEEREAFGQLGTEEEREQFIEQFWLRRDPTPDTLENESKEEHYRRIAYANERFASGLRGWETDRGHLYIMYGPPDELESHPAGGMYDRPMEEGGGFTMTHAYEKWRYRYLEVLGNDITLEFVDVTGSGEYRLTMDPSEKDALTEIPGAGLGWYEGKLGHTKQERFLRADGTRLPYTPHDTMRMSEFDRIERFMAVQKPPPVKFKDLEAVVTTRISFHLLPFDLRTDFLRLTDQTVLVPITVSLQRKNLTFATEDGIQRAVVNIFGRITTVGGRIVQTFEDVIQLDVPPSLFESSLNQPAVYQKAVPLRSGIYKLNLVLKDLNSGDLGTLERRLTVPRFAEDGLAHSSLILADLIERVPTKETGRGQFVLGATKVRPAVKDQFRQNGQVGIYMQVYDLAINPATGKPDATIDYTVLRGGEIVFQQRETTAELPQAGQQITVEKRLGLGTLRPGEYKLRITVTDQVRQRAIMPTASFRIVP